MTRVQAMIDDLFENDAAMREKMRRAWPQRQPTKRVFPTPDLDPKADEEKRRRAAQYRDHRAMGTPAPGHERSSSAFLP